MKDLFTNNSNCETIFIADIAANHDGSLSRAKNLINLAKEAGADVAKFQHFKAEKIVSDLGFKTLKGLSTHQTTWEKSVFETYADASLPDEWTVEIYNHCIEVGISFMTTPYDGEVLSHLNELVPAFKVGSGDIDCLQHIQNICDLNKPILIAAGAADLTDVMDAMDIIIKNGNEVCLMQCNTNYTAALDNFRYINLNVLKTFSRIYPNILLGLSDHTPGHSTVLGAIALGARVIEKHFTDDNARSGPDHKFALNPKDWREMVDRSQELEFSLGDGIKRVEANELESKIVQRRCVRYRGSMDIGDIVTDNDLEVLRPAPVGSISPKFLPTIIGKKLTKAVARGQEVLWDQLI